MLDVDMGEALELPAGAARRGCCAQPMGPADSGKPARVLEAGHATTFHLEPFEVLTLQQVPQRLEGHCMRQQRLAPQGFSSATCIPFVARVRVLFCPRSSVSTCLRSSLRNAPSNLDRFRISQAEFLGLFRLLGMNSILMLESSTPAPRFATPRDISNDSAITLHLN